MRSTPVLNLKDPPSCSFCSFSYAARISAAVLSLPPHLRPTEADLMTWQFYGGTLDPKNRTRENIVFFFCMDPAKLTRMTRWMYATGRAVSDADVRPAVDPNFKLEKCSDYTGNYCGR